MILAAGVIHFRAMEDSATSAGGAGLMAEGCVWCSSRKPSSALEEYCTSSISPSPADGVATDLAAAGEAGGAFCAGGNTAT
ncbi:hypothetical protein V6N12_045704 [Hibiscus sabdariffa]|uniref:Secreted protein n=1 Tax=Hibiscus sabdariffa TaxID=183260 RepID=A0ABR2G3Q8_9ROSI